MALNHIKSILQTVIYIVENDEETQYNDIADYMEEIDELIVNESLSLCDHWEDVCNEIYISKGNMTDVLANLHNFARAITHSVLAKP